MSTARIKVLKENCLEDTNDSKPSNSNNVDEAKIVFNSSAGDVRNNIKCDSDNCSGLQNSNANITINEVKDKSKNVVHEEHKVAENLKHATNTSLQPIRKIVSQPRTLEELNRKKDKGEIKSNDDIKEAMSISSRATRRNEKCDSENRSGYKKSSADIIIRDIKDSKSKFILHEEHKVAEDFKHGSIISLQSVRRAASQSTHLEEPSRKRLKRELKIKDDFKDVSLPLSSRVTKGYDKNNSKNFNQLKNFRTTILIHDIKDGKRKRVRREEHKVITGKRPTSKGLQSVRRTASQSRSLEEPNRKRNKRELQIKDDLKKALPQSARVTRSQAKKRVELCKIIFVENFKDAGDVKNKTITKVKPVSKTRAQLKRRPGSKAPKGLAKKK